MLNLPEALHGRLNQANQGHVLKWWPSLSAEQRRALTQQLEKLDLDLLQRLYAERDQQSVLPAEDRIAPIPVGVMDEADRAAGEEALRRGEVAVLLVAGGQGSRLGFEHPKGMFPIGPVRNTCLFQILAEKTIATGRRFGKALPFLVMTSPATHDETVAFFAEHHNFGLPAGDVYFFCQGTMPALDLATSKLLMESPGQLFLSPNGHGGTLLALAEAGLLETLGQRGIRHVFYCQVDNPATRIADPLFLGHHIRARAEVSTKAIAKNGPLDKLGNLVLLVDACEKGSGSVAETAQRVLRTTVPDPFSHTGRCAIIEYSDLPERLAHQTDADGRLRYRVGNPAIHIFDLEFLKRVSIGDLRIPFHVARKKVPHINDAGQRVEPTNENALKFEMFIFDVLPRAERWTVVETDRDEEFHPVKNATGVDSAATARQALSNIAGAWLEQAGATIPRSADGNVAVPLEVSPLFALDAAELGGKINNSRMTVTGPLFLAPAD